MSTDHREAQAKSIKLQRMLDCGANNEEFRELAKEVAVKLYENEVERQRLFKKNFFRKREIKNLNHALLKAKHVERCLQNKLFDLTIKSLDSANPAPEAMTQAEPDLTPAPAPEVEVETVG